MKRVLFLISFLAATVLHAQEQFGAAFSNYTPTQSVFMNPSSMLDSKTWLDIHIVGAGAFGINNMVYVKRSSVIESIVNGSENYFKENIAYNRNRRTNAVYNRDFVSVVSGVWSQGNHAAGVLFNVRSFTSVRGIPDEAFDIIDGSIAGRKFEQNKDYSYRDLNVSSLTFGEVQLSYAYTFIKQKRDMLMGGISLKKFIPLLGAATRIYDVRFNQSSDTSFAYIYADMDAMYTNRIAPTFKGGMGLDIGFTYQKMQTYCQSYYPNSRKNGCKQVPYLYKIGVSILDIGSVKYNPNTVQAKGIRINYQDTYYANFNSINQDSAFQMIQSLDTIINDADIKNSNKIHLPTALSIQFDYNLWQSKVYFNASLMQGFPISNNRFGSRRPNSLMAGVRYESRIFDVSIPFSLYEYHMPQLGFEFRIYCLTIGTDKLLSLVGTSQVYGADIYAALKIPIFYNPQCRTKMKNKNRSEAAKQKKFKKKMNDCPAYQ
ncbi:MAG: DUF5723 family protein [Crocinitomicaceae bacterium]